MTWQKRKGATMYKAAFKSLDTGKIVNVTALMWPPGVTDDYPHWTDEEGKSHGRCCEEIPPQGYNHR